MAVDISPLRVYRTAQNKSQKAVAEQAGVSRITFGCIERGEHRPKVDTALAIARALNVEPRDLWPEREPNG